MGVTKTKAATPTPTPIPSGESGALSTASLEASIRTALAGKLNPDPDPDPEGIGTGETPEVAPTPTPIPSPIPTPSGEEPGGEEPPTPSGEEPGGEEPPTLPMESGESGESGVTELRVPISSGELKAALEEEKAAREKLEGRLARLEGKEAKPPEPPDAIPTPSGEGQFGEEPEMARLLQEEREQQGVATWARSQLRRLRTDPEGVMKALEAAKLSVTDQTEEGIRDLLEEVQASAFQRGTEVRTDRRVHERYLRDQVGRAQSVARAEAERLAPELKDGKSKRSELFAGVMAGNPGLRLHPNGPLIAAIQVLGLERFQEERLKAKGESRFHREKAEGGAGAGAEAGKRVERGTTTRLPGTPVVLPGGATPASEPNSSELLGRFQKSGRLEDKEAWMTAVVRGQVKG